MFVFFNPNPDAKRVGDCTVRAIAKAMNTVWDKTYLALCVEGLRVHDMPSANSVWGSYLKANGFRQHALPDTCPECGAPVVRDPDGAALRCTGAECPAQRLRNIAHFASREAMDIDGLGISLCQSLIDSGLVRSPAELYSLEPQAVAALDHMGKKSAENLITAIEKSKDAGMARLLCAFGIRQVGQKAAKVLAMHFGTLDKLMAATEDELMAIPDVGPTTAAYLRAWFANPQSQHQIRLLRAAGVSFESKEQIVDHRFAGKTFVLTGALEHFSRDEAGAIIERFGGKTSSSVSKKTSYLLAGENTGSKYQKALTLGTPIVTEAEFLAMIQE